VTAIRHCFSGQVHIAQCGTRGNSQLCEHLPQMGIDGTRTYIQLCSDRLGARAGRHQLGHLEFLRRKARRTVLIAAYGLSGCSELGSGARRPRNCVDTFEDLDGHAEVRPGK